MATLKKCDVCNKMTTSIVAKVFLGPGDHSEYTVHADVGECCLQRVNIMFDWQKRKKRTAKNAA